MKRGIIVGEVWATRKAKGLGGMQLKLVALTDAQGETGRVLVAIDTLGARAGQDVLVALGSGARNVLRPGPDNRDLLCDAAVALLVDSPKGRDEREVR